MYMYNKLQTKFNEDGCEEKKKFLTYVEKQRRVFRIWFCGVVLNTCGAHGKNVCVLGAEFLRLVSFCFP